MLHSDPCRTADPDHLADLASLRALLICAVRELGLDPDRIPTPEGRLQVRTQQDLATGLGRLQTLTLEGAQGTRPIDAGHALRLMMAWVAQAYGPPADQLVARIAGSRERMARMLPARIADPQPQLDFLAAEQALLFGHWMHPCPKALTGMTRPEERAMTPDWHGRLRLHALSVRADLIEATDPTIARDLPGMEVDPGAGRIILPAHPLTWDRAKGDPQIAAALTAGDIVDLGPVGDPLWATSSVRTLWRGDCRWQVKVSLPVTITNSQRVNKRHELLAGAAMARRIGGLMARCGPLRLIGDPHWMTLRLPGRDESGLEVIFRDNPWQGGKVMQVAGLVAEPLPGRASLLAQVMAGYDAARWFDAYLACAVAPLLRIYDATGIAVEAHQQNALLDLSHGLPRRCDIRDNQGFYVAEDMADAELRAIAQLVYPRSEAEDALTYTLIVNQVFGVIHRMALDGIMTESHALDRLAAHLRGLTDLPGHGGRLAARWLSDADLPAKGNMLTQLGGTDELLIPGERAPMIRVPNPLPRHAKVLADVA